MMINSTDTNVGLKLNSSQLQFLAFVQSQGDWHYSAFREEVIDEYRVEFLDDDAAFEQMRQQLRNLSEEQMLDLQLAVGVLGGLGWQP